jgi:hypothetical protein
MAVIVLEGDDGALLRSTPDCAALIFLSSSDKLLVYRRGGIGCGGRNEHGWVNVRSAETRLESSRHHNALDLKGGQSANDAMHMCRPETCGKKVVYLKAKAIARSDMPKSSLSPAIVQCLVRHRSGAEVSFLKRLGRKHGS